MEDRIVTQNMDQLLRRLAEARRSIAADQELIALLQAEKAQRDPLYFAARALCSAVRKVRPVLEIQRLYQAMLVVDSETTPHREEEAS
jgi:hypothetical protein